MKQVKNVMIILYNEPLKDVIEILRPYKWAYIKHDKDFTEEGEIKKEHWHLLLSFETKKSLSLIAKVLNVEENLIECVNNYKSMERYLIHLDNPEKYQYNCNEVISNYDYNIQVYSTTESILKFLIEECEKYTDVREFNLAVMKLGIDYMKVYKAYYSMIKDVIYYQSKKIEWLRIENQKNTSLINEMNDAELLKRYESICLNKGDFEETSFELKVLRECEKRGLILCKGLRKVKEENEKNR